MAAAANLGAIHALAPVECSAVGGCAYLRTLSTIEHIAGFERSARSYGAAASRCRRLGCWAASHDEAPTAVRSGGGAAEPVPFPRTRSTSEAEAKAATESSGQTITFSRSSLIDIVSDQAGNFVERRALKLESLPESGDSIGHLYRYWRDLRALTECSLANIDTVHLSRAGVIGSIHLVDVSSSDPGEFSFDLLGYAVPLRNLEKPCAHPVAIYADVTLRDYNTVRLTAAPRLHKMRCRLGDTMHHYTRLILPFFNAQGAVERLLVAIRQEPGNNIQVEAGD